MQSGTLFSHSRDYSILKARYRESSSPPTDVVNVGIGRDIQTFPNALSVISRCQPHFVHIHDTTSSFLLKLTTTATRSWSTNSRSFFSKQRLVSSSSALDYSVLTTFVLGEDYLRSPWRVHCSQPPRSPHNSNPYRPFPSWYYGSRSVFRGLIQLVCPVCA